MAKSVREVADEIMSEYHKRQAQSEDFVSTLREEIIKELKGDDDDDKGQDDCDVD